MKISKHDAWVDDRDLKISVMLRALEHISEMPESKSLETVDLCKKYAAAQKLAKAAILEFRELGG